MCATPPGAPCLPCRRPAWATPASRSLRTKLLYASSSDTEMSEFNKVVWSEGLFLKPHHFQQQERYHERYVESRVEALRSFGWGFVELQIDRDLLSIGKLALRRATGVFPDGTPFRMPDDYPLPPPLEVGAQVRDQVVYLATPLRAPSALDVSSGNSNDVITRHRAVDSDVRDSTATS